MADEVSRADKFAAEDHSLAVDLAWEAEEDQKSFKIALFVALLFHIVLIWASIPDMGNKDFVQDKKEEKIMRRVVLRPPPEQKLQQLKLKQKVQKVPVPDPTPDEPEPIVPIDTNDNQQLDMTDSDYIIGIPDAPPAPTGPVREGTVGLEKPVYNLQQLQANVVYPELGKKARMQGYVILEAVLKKNGTVGDVRVIGGNLKSLGFPEAAMRAVRKLKFTPGKLRGQPVDVILTLTVTFRVRS